MKIKYVQILLLTKDSEGYSQILYSTKISNNKKTYEHGDGYVTEQDVLTESCLQTALRDSKLDKEFVDWYHDVVDDVNPFYPEYKLRVSKVIEDFIATRHPEMSLLIYTDDVDLLVELI